MPLPYLTAPGNVKKALAGIITTTAPPIVDAAFINEALDIPGTSGKQVATWLKKIGFIDAEGAPTEIYRRFRIPESTSDAALSALHTGYAALYSRQPLLHELPDEQLAELIRSEIARGLGSNVVNLVRASIKSIAAYAGKGASQLRGNHGIQQSAGSPSLAIRPSDQVTIPLTSLSATGNSTTQSHGVVDGTVYNIYLTLPATSDEAVFTALFSAIKSTLIG